MYPDAPTNQTIRHSRRGFSLWALLAVAVTSAAIVFAYGAINPPQARAATQTYTQYVRQVIANSVLRKSVPSNLTPSLSTVASERPTPYRDDCHAPVSVTNIKLCYYGPAGGDKTIALFGDSHAAHWYPAVLQIAYARGWRFLYATKSGCPAPEISLYIAVADRNYVECDQWREKALQMLEAEQPDVILVQSSVHYNGVADRSKGTLAEQWARGTRSMVRRLRVNSRVIVFRDTPNAKVIAPKCIAANRSDVRVCNRLRSDAYTKPYLRKLEWDLAKQGGATVVDSFRWFCTDRCPVIVGRRQVYRDHTHMTITYSKFLAPIVAKVYTAVLSGTAQPGVAYQP